MGVCVLGMGQGHRMNANQIRITTHSPGYWQVTLSHPPLNIFGPESIPKLAAVISALEQDAHVKVVVFDSDVPGYFLTHYDFLASLAGC